MAIKTGQFVKVMSGKDKGKTGKVIQVFPKDSRLVVDGVNTMFKHGKRRQKQGGEKGERVEFFGPIHLSNVKLADETKEKAAPASKGAAKK